jgi:hypothetical protein
MVSFRERIVAAWHWLREMVTPSDAAWNGAAIGLVGFWALFVVSFIELGLVPHFTIGSAIGLVTLFVLLALTSAVLLLPFWLVSLLKPRYRAALLLALLPTALVMLGIWYVPGVLIGTTATFLGLSLFFGAGTVLLKQRSTTTLVYFLFGAVILIALGYGFFKAPADPNPALAGYHLKDHTLALPDPGKPGPYEVTAFTYGSGKDPHRPEYAEGARIVSHAVDATKLDKQWTGLSGWVRSLYWGFGPSAFPVQGRVWMPAKSEGPFPLVLIVHGNHAMEDFSDPGYAYLGELLASQGFILVSVDENFLNSSVADCINPFAMRTGSETRVRAWMLLEHLAQWRNWNKDPRSPLFGKIDMDHIGLIGHSRGGEAVAVANAFNALDNYPDDATLPFRFRFKLGAIAAIAPADGQYAPRARATPMRDTNYFTIHGSMDGDVTSFAGSSQYSRATFSRGSPAFKASLYVTDANHGQFNTAWGRNDLDGLPMALLLDERPIMDPEAQRQVAKVYLSAFLHATLKGADGYRALFQDARNGAGWLPDVFMINNYADGGMTMLLDAEEDLDPSTGTGAGVRITGENLSVWRETFIDRKDDNLDTEVALLAWDERVHKKRASFGWDLGPNPPATDAGTDLVFSLSRTDISTVPDDFEVPKGSGDPRAGEQPLDWHVAVTDANGTAARLKLSHDQVLYPQVVANTRRIAEISSLAPSEIVMRHYRFALKDFAAANPKLDVTRLRSIRFEFDISARGAIVVDDVGLARE